MPNKQTVFISDLHLDEAHPNIADIFIRFLDQLNHDTSALYILGDLFEAWIGDDDDTLFHQKIISALSSVSQRGIPIFILRGNRDFLLGKKFLRETGATLLKDETIMNVYGERVLLMHGDALCTDDAAFMRARKIMYNRFIQTVFLWLPLRLRRHIASNMRAASKNYTRTADAAIMDVTQDAVISVMKKYNVNTLIHGHTHRECVHTVMIEEHESKRIVLDAWHDTGHAYVWREDATREMIVIN